MPFAPSRDIQLYYEVHGPEVGTAPVIVFAHGAGGNHLSWWQQVPHFSRRATCVSFDHRGFGQSREAAGGPGGAAFADDLRALLDHLRIRRATLVAQSMGGWTCLGFALRNMERVERLVMCDTHGGITSDEIATAWNQSLAQLATLPPEVNPAAGARMCREQPELHFLYAQISSLNPPRTLAEIGALLQAAGAPTVAEVAVLDTPVLFICGGEDILVPPSVLEAAARAFRYGRIAHVAAAGHSVYFERSQTFNAIVDDFVYGSMDAR
jgi:3-oxoadipate enol-lactonase